MGPRNSSWSIGRVLERLNNVYLIWFLCRVDGPTIKLDLVLLALHFGFCCALISLMTSMTCLLLLHTILHCTRGKVLAWQKPVKLNLTFFYPGFYHFASISHKITRVVSTAFWTDGCKGTKGQNIRRQWQRQRSAMAMLMTMSNISTGSIEIETVQQA